VWRLGGVVFQLLVLIAQFSAAADPESRPTSLLGRPESALPRRAPADAGMNAQELDKIDALVAAALAEKKMPGCVVCIGRRGAIVWQKAYGWKQVEPTQRPMTVDTVFDLASLTKPIATATSILLLAERGKIKLDERVAAYLPEFAAAGKDAVTVRDLLIHQSGLIADNALADYEQGPEEALRRIFALKLTAPTGSKFIYSDVNFIVLGELVRRVSGADLQAFTQRELFGPLGMRDTTFLPPEPLKIRTAPTERRGEVWIQGEVHDPRAARLGGIAGHAGLFSTADDLAIFAAMLLGGGQYQETRVLAAETVSRMGEPHKVSSGVRGPGWDKRTGFSSNRGEGMTDLAFGHGGFTGTTFWIDPGLDLFVIFLSNRLHPHGKGNVNALAGRLGSVAVASISAAKTEK